MAKIKKKNDNLKKLIWLLPVVLWFVLTIKLFLTENPVEGDSFLLNLEFGDKIGHFGVFGILTAFLMFSLCGGNFLSRNKKKIRTVVLVIIFSWGATTEILQEILLDSREGDFLDFIADASAGVIGIFCYETLAKYWSFIPIYKKNKVFIQRTNTLFLTDH